MADNFAQNKNRKALANTLEMPTPGMSKPKTGVVVGPDRQYGTGTMGKQPIAVDNANSNKKAYGRLALKLKSKAMEKK